MSTFAFEKQMRIAKAQAEARTMFEVIKACENEQQMAKILCRLHEENGCDSCPESVSENCWGYHNGFLTWLESKEEVNLINLMKEDMK